MATLRKLRLVFNGMAIPIPIRPRGNFGGPMDSADRYGIMKTEVEKNVFVKASRAEALGKRQQPLG